ncbi:MAG: 2-isopropylmalate synthase [Candidatus Calescibacterium sp.]|nr:2-isopropylmalate synthase [Candidatus Calescibacterium sp.]MDW8132420.1 2-isopropylmalate synthase [Candidatus Calescibacterium sp.]
MERVYIFDTTLRDGDQTPGVNLKLEQKIEIAKELERARVDVIEAGFAASSAGEFENVKTIASIIKESTVATLCRTVSRDIDIGWEAVKNAANPRIHVFISTSDIHLQTMMKKSRDEVLEITENMVKYAKKYCSDIEFSAQDATRSDWDFLIKVLQIAVKNGATTINIPDTVGYTVPEEYSLLIKTILEKVDGKYIVSTHCHDDLGLAVANSLAAVKAGARQVEGCINGIGERAGNTALEEVIMAIKIRKDFFNLWTNVDTTRIYNLSKMVSSYSGIPIQPNKAIVGLNAFRHQSGVHQHGVVSNRMNYEIIDPQDIGLPKGGIIVLNKNSGRHGLKAKLNELGFQLTEDQINKVFEKFKKIADSKGEIKDEELVDIVKEEIKNF